MGDGLADGEAEAEADRRGAALGDAEGDADASVPPVSVTQKLCCVTSSVTPFWAAVAAFFVG